MGINKSNNWGPGFTILIGTGTVRKLSCLCVVWLCLFIYGLLYLANLPIAAIFDADQDLNFQVDADWDLSPPPWPKKCVPV